jgi:hypothetical protein
MSLRTVFGRRQVEFEGKTFTIELRKDGLYIRQKHSRSEWRYPFEKLLNHAKRQPEFFYQMVEGNQSQSVSCVPQGSLVLIEPAGQPGVVHESGEQPPQAAEDGGTGVVTSAEWGAEVKLSPFIKSFPDDHTPSPPMQPFTGPLENPDPEPSAAAASPEPPCEPGVSPDAGSDVGDGASGLGLADEGR